MGQSATPHRSTHMLMSSLFCTQNPSQTYLFLLLQKLIFHEEQWQMTVGIKYQPVSSSCRCFCPVSVSLLQYNSVRWCRSHPTHVCTWCMCVAELFSNYSSFWKACQGLINYYLSLCRFKKNDITFRSTLSQCLQKYDRHSDAWSRFHWKLPDTYVFCIDWRLQKQFFFYFSEQF